MKMIALLLSLSLPVAASAAPAIPAVAAIPAVTDARNAAAGYAVGNAGLADSLAKVCTPLGEPVAAEMAAARAAWMQRNGRAVGAGLRWIQHRVERERGARGDAAAAQLNDGLKAAIRDEVMATLKGIFPNGAADVQADVCRDWAAALQSPESDLSANGQHGPALAELAAIAWPATPN